MKNQLIEDGKDFAGLLLFLAVCVAAGMVWL